MKLDPEARETLAEELLLSLSPADCAAIDASWLKESHRRLDRFNRGETTASSADEILKQLERKAKA